MRVEPNACPRRNRCPAESLNRVDWVLFIGDMQER